MNLLINQAVHWTNISWVVQNLTRYWRAQNIYTSVCVASEPLEDKINRICFLLETRTRCEFVCVETFLPQSFQFQDKRIICWVTAACVRIAGVAVSLDGTSTCVSWGKPDCNQRSTTVTDHKPTTAVSNKLLPQFHNFCPDASLPHWIERRNDSVEQSICLVVTGLGEGATTTATTKITTTNNTTQSFCWPNIAKSPSATYKKCQESLVEKYLITFVTSHNLTFKPWAAKIATWWKMCMQMVDNTKHTVSPATTGRCHYPCVVSWKSHSQGGY